jgi:hypothetical protein
MPLEIEPSGKGCLFASLQQQKEGVFVTQKDKTSTLTFSE